GPIRPENPASLAGAALEAGVVDGERFSVAFRQATGRDHQASSAAIGRRAPGDTLRKRGRSRECGYHPCSAWGFPQAQPPPTPSAVSSTRRIVTPAKMPWTRTTGAGKWRSGGTGTTLLPSLPGRPPTSTAT